MPCPSTPTTPSFTVSVSGEKFWEALTAEHRSRRDESETLILTHTSRPMLRNPPAIREQYVRCPGYHEEEIDSLMPNNNGSPISTDLMSGETNASHRIGDGRTDSPHTERGDFGYPLPRNEEFHPWAHDGEDDEYDKDDEPLSSQKHSAPEQGLIDRIVNDLNEASHCDSKSTQSSSVISAGALTDPFIDFSGAPRTLSMMLSDLFPEDAEAIYTYDKLSGSDMPIPADHAIDFDELAERLAKITDRSSHSTEGGDSAIVHRQNNAEKDDPPFTMTMLAMFQDVVDLIDVVVDTDARLQDVRDTVYTHHDEQQDTTNELASRLQEVADYTYDRLVQVRTELTLLQARVAEVEDVRRGLDRVRERLAISESAEEELGLETGDTGQGVYLQRGVEHGSVTAGLGVYHYSLLRGMHASASDLFRRRSYAGLRSAHSGSSGVIEEEPQLQGHLPASEGLMGSREGPPEDALVLRNKDSSNEQEGDNALVGPDTDAANHGEKCYYEPRSGSGWGYVSAQLQAYVFAICIVAGASLI